MKEIPLTQGKVALVDDGDYDYLSQWEWYANKGGNTFYAKRNISIRGKQTQIKMHRVILQVKEEDYVDHKDHNGLNNQRYNIRVSSRDGNEHNRGKRSNNTTGYKGVVQDKRRVSTTYEARITVNGERVYLGRFAAVEEAARAYDEAAKKLHGEFACLNFPEA
jgi:hypothetical protein